MIRSLTLGLIFGFITSQLPYSLAQEATREAPPKAKPKSAADKADKKDDAKSEGKTDAKGQGKKDNAKRQTKKAESSQAFVRTVKDDKKQVVTLQTAVVTYKATSGPYAGAEVDLIGAIHIADKSYYKTLNEMFRSYDALLYEMVTNPEMVKELKNGAAKDRSAISALQGGMKDLLGLSFQLEEVDYQAKNFVHADMNPEQFNQSLTERQEGLMQFMMRSMGASLATQGSKKGNDLNFLAAMLSSNRELALKRVFAEQMEEMDGQLAAIAGDDGKSTLITERNAKALEVLKKELDAGKKHLGIFYGAGHLSHMHEELAKQFQMQPVKTVWLDAWDMSK